MPGASLEVLSPAWRAGRASACVGALLQGRAAADDVLDHLSGVGEPPGGWWEALGGARAAGGVMLLLPRPGDPRGLALPRGIAAEAALGWTVGSGTIWLIPDAPSGWSRVDGPQLTAAPLHPDEAMRGLRKAIVDAAHSVDAQELDAREGDTCARQDQESLVDSWVLGPPALPTATRHLAAMGLRMLLALDGARALVDTLPLEQAARSAVESAFTRTATPG